VSPSRRRWQIHGRLPGTVTPSPVVLVRVDPAPRHAEATTAPRAPARRARLGLDDVRLGPVVHPLPALLWRLVGVAPPGPLVVLVRDLGSERWRDAEELPDVVLVVLVDRRQLLALEPPGQ